MAVMAMAFSPLSGRAVGHRGPRLPLFVAGACMTAGALMLTGLSAGTPLALLLLSYAVFGIGFGSVNPPITFTAVSGMPDNQAGVAAAVASTSRQVGQALGVALTGSILGTVVASHASLELSSASHAAWWLIAGCGIAVFVIGAVSTGAWALRGARICSERLSSEASADPLVAG
jgi:MFS family permease